MNHIKLIHDKKENEFCHRKFIRFGMGNFEREKVIIKFGGKAVQIQAGFEYVDVFYKFVAKIVKEKKLEDKFSISGDIVSKKDLTSKFEKLNIELKNKTSKKYSFSCKLNSKQFIEFVNEFENTFLLINLTSKYFQIKTKKSIPKPGKLVEKFVSLKIDNKFKNEVIDEFLFDITNKEGLKSAEISHIYKVNEIKIPKEFENDPEQARINAKRIGIIERKVVVKTKSGEETIENQIKFSV